MDVAETKQFAENLWFNEEESTMINYNGKEIRAHIIANSPFLAGKYSTKMHVAVRKRDLETAPKVKDLVIIDGQRWKVHFDKIQGNIVAHDDIEYIIPLKTDQRVPKFR